MYGVVSRQRQGENPRDPPHSAPQEFHRSSKPYKHCLWSWELTTGSAASALNASRQSRSTSTATVHGARRRVAPVAPECRDHCCAHQRSRAVGIGCRTASQFRSKRIARPHDELSTILTVAVLSLRFHGRCPSCWPASNHAASPVPDGQPCGARGSLGGGGFTRVAVSHLQRDNWSDNLACGPKISCLSSIGCASALPGQWLTVNDHSVTGQ